MLAVLNDGNMFRPTQDLDLDGSGDGNIHDIEELIYALARVSPESEGGTLPFDDGLTFEMDTIRVRKDREGAVSGGKVEFKVKLGKARIVARMDVGFGNPIIPHANLIEYPSLLADDKKNPIPAPKILMYSVYSAVAEKMRILAEFGEINTRIRDYYDLYFYFNEVKLDQDMLVKALDATFKLKDVEVPAPTEEWGGLSQEYISRNQINWIKYIQNGNVKYPTPTKDFENPKTGKIEQIPDFAGLVENIKDNIMPAMKKLYILRHGNSLNNLNLEPQNNPL